MSIPYQFINRSFMKQLLLIALLLLTVTSHANDLMNTTIDASSEAALKVSLEKFKSLPKDKGELLSNAMTGLIMSNAFPKVFEGAFSNNPETSNPEKMIRDLLHNKTPNQIIEEFNKLDKKPDVEGFTSSMIELSKQKEIKTKYPEIISFNKPFIASELKITVNEILIDNLRPEGDLPSSQKYLLVRIKIENISEGVIYKLLTPWKNSYISDNFDNSFEPNYNDYRFMNQDNVIYSDDIMPKQTLDDTIIFPSPLKNASSFKLILEPKIYRKKDNKIITTSDNSKFKLIFDREDIVATAKHSKSFKPKLSRDDGKKIVINGSTEETYYESIQKIRHLDDLTTEFQSAYSFLKDDKKKFYKEINGSTIGQIIEKAKRIKNEQKGYTKKVKLYDVTAKKYTTYLKENVPGVKFKLKNLGNRTLSNVEVTFYFKNKEGNIIFEEDYNPVYVGSYSSSSNKPLKPGYIWSQERDTFYKAEEVPDEWKVGSFDAQVTKVEFLNKNLDKKIEIKQPSPNNISKKRVKKDSHAKVKKAPIKKSKELNTRKLQKVQTTQKNKQKALLSWGSKIQHHVKRRWHPPPGNRGKQAKVKLTIASTGFISGGVHIKSCNGNADFCASVKEAFERSEPLPRPPRDLNLTKAERTIMFKLD